MYVIEIPAHTSHVLEPLGVTVYGPFKSHIQREVHASAVNKCVIDVFNVAEILKFALSDAVTVSNVINGFQKCGLGSGR